MTAVGSQREITLKAQPLTAEGFAPFGRVITDEREALRLQEGHFTARLMTVQRAPQTIEHINRHLDHSQMFVPLNGHRTVLVVAAPDVPEAGFDASKIAAFVTDGRTAVLFHPGTWHIEPRALDRDACQVINVQTNVFRDHTELVRLADAGWLVRLETE